MKSRILAASVKLAVNPLPPLALLVAALAVTLAAGCARKPETPNVATVPASKATTGYPKRIISLTPSVTEVLYDLGLGDRIVGVTKQCDYPPTARLKPKIGDVTTSIERIVQQNPDIVIGHAFLNDKSLAAIARLGIKTLGVDPKTLDQVPISIEQIADACGVKDRGSKLAKTMTAEIEAVRLTYANKTSRPLVMFAVQGRPLFVAGPSTFVHAVTQAAGGKNVATGSQPGFFQMSQEVAVQNDPDFIFVTDSTNQKYFLTAPIWSKSQAVRLRHVVLVNPDLFLRPTPRLVQGLRQMARVIGSVKATGRQQ